MFIEQANSVGSIPIARFLVLFMANIYARMKKGLLLYTIYYILTTVLTGCATVSLAPPAPPKGMTGIYHQVQKGQTLWRISQAYGVELERIAQINRLADTSRIYVGQLIFIPDANEKILDLRKEEILLEDLSFQNKLWITLNITLDVANQLKSFLKV